MSTGYQNRKLSKVNQDSQNKLRVTTSPSKTQQSCSYQALHLTTKKLWPQHKNKHVEILKGKKRKGDIEEAQDLKNNMAGSSLGFLVSLHIFSTGCSRSLQSRTTISTKRIPGKFYFFWPMNQEKGSLTQKSFLIICPLLQANTNRKPHPFLLLYLYIFSRPKGDLYFHTPSCPKVLKFPWVSVNRTEQEADLSLSTRVTSTDLAAI